MFEQYFEVPIDKITKLYCPECGNRCTEEDAEQSFKDDSYICPECESKMIEDDGEAI